MEYLAFYSHKDGVQPGLLDYMEELEIFVKEPLKLLNEMMTTMYERGEFEDSPLMNSLSTTFWSCLLRWEELDRFFKKELRGDHPGDFRTQVENTMESRQIHDLDFQFRTLPDHLKESLRSSFFTREEYGALRHLVEAQKKSEEGAEQQATA